MRVEKFETDFFEKKIILKHLHPPIEKEIERQRSEINSPETFDHEWQCPKTKKLSNSLRRSEERNEEKQQKKKKKGKKSKQKRGKGCAARPMTRHRSAPLSNYPQLFCCAKPGVQLQALEKT